MGTVTHLFPEASHMVPYCAPATEPVNIRPALSMAIKSLTENFRKAQAGDETARHRITVLAGYELAPTLTRLAETLLGELPPSPAGSGFPFSSHRTLAEAGFSCDFEPSDGPGDAA